MGKIIPDNISAGRKPATIEAMLAKSWFFNTLDITKPIPNGKRNVEPSEKSQPKKKKNYHNMITTMTNI
jgi:hypothetical protein